jgi:hypothetical protein
VLIVGAMFSRKAESPPAFQVPSPADDRPSWIKVGVIAAVGFAIGVAWPRVAGLKLGPNAPEPPHAAAAKSADPSSSAVPVLATAPVMPPALSASAAPAASAPTVTFGHGFVLSCKDKDGESMKGAACGAVGGFDGLAQPRLKKLAQCQAAEGVSGKLAVVFTIDFSNNHLGVDPGKATTISGADGLISCVRSAFQGAALGGMEHEHTRYSILYTLTLASPNGAAGASSATPASSAAGGDASAQVGWETALVRDNPQTGAILARLQRGTKVKVGAIKEGWYPIKYGPDFASDGWVYRGAIGK